ncbi:phosphatidylethanolamine-binding protein, putative [Plasmodium chabaudi chabaudi]|uniref:Phosphatidylethanolamine-binding protein, putative n=1 Tax=Plasmodium chabaudi chabaudi TaxID=31271 RepID=A0A1C6X4C6_PLACU|nr:phosphatidylethanolamine-binding protein, putative [Plasmodium chabaudi chabaudi]
MNFLEFAFLLCYLFSATFVLAKIDIIQSDYGQENCSSDDAKLLDKDFYGESCGGKNLLPSIEWIDNNNMTKSYIITLSSVSNSNVVYHLIAWNIPSYINTINSFSIFDETKSQVGLNTYNKKNYQGPCHTSINTEHTGCLKLTLYALKKETIELSDDADSHELMSYLRAMSRKENIVIDAISLYSIFIPQKS